MIRKLNLNIGNSQSVFSIVEKERVQTMKIGIMGGTFEPIHIGHLLLGEFAYEDFGLDEIWFLPNGNPPHKETLDTEEAMHHRIEMVRLAIKSNPNFSLNLSEADTKKHSYTYQTMRHFNEIYPNDEFYFILGADSLFAFEEWKDFRKIFTTCTILAAITEAYGAHIELLRAPLVEISSTTIRERVAKGLSVRYMVPDVVADYIKEKNLYI